MKANYTMLGRILLSVVLVSSALSVSLSRVNAKHSSVPVKGILPYLDNNHFRVKPGELVVIPLTVAVGSSFDGRVSVTQDPNILAVAQVHWMSGSYSSCGIAPSPPPSTPANLSGLQPDYRTPQSTVAKVISYTHMPGEIRDHNMCVWFKSGTPAGTFKSTLIVMTGGKTYRLPFEVEIL